MKIPRILHQTWKDNDVPETFSRLSETWRKEHAGWEYILWTDEMNRDFIREHFDFFLPVYDGYEKNIQRVDAVRYFVLYKYGGCFIDLDFECLANIEPILHESVCVFGKEPEEHCSIHRKTLIISNAFMGAIPGFHFFASLCDGLMNHREFTDHANDRVLESTGPFMLSRFYLDYGRKSEIDLLDADLIYPLTKAELSDLSQGIRPYGIEQKLQRAYGIHHYAGTWWKK